MLELVYLTSTTNELCSALLLQYGYRWNVAANCSSNATCPWVKLRFDLGIGATPGWGAFTCESLEFPPFLLHSVVSCLRVCNLSLKAHTHQARMANTMRSRIRTSSTRAALPQWGCCLSQSAASSGTITRRPRFCNTQTRRRASSMKFGMRMQGLCLSNTRVSTVTFAPTVHVPASRFRCSSDLTFADPSQMQNLWELKAWGCGPPTAWITGIPVM